MELLIDNQPASIAAGVVNEYARANAKNIELSKVAAKHLKLKLPLLVKDSTIEFPLSILTTLLEVQRVGPILYGANSIEKAQTSGWVEAANTMPPKEFISLLENKLLTRTFLVSNHITIADIAAYAVIQPVILSLSNSERLQYVCVLRWASHLQSLPGLKEKLPHVPVPERSFEVPHALVKGPAVEELKAPPSHKLNPEDLAHRKSTDERSSKRSSIHEEFKSPKEKKAKEDKKKAQEETKAPQEKKKEENKGPQEKKPKGEAKPQEKKKPAKAEEAPEEGGDAFQYLELRVGRVEKVWRHPEADRLFCETVDLGAEKRTVVSGLVGHITEEEFTGKLVVLLANLKKSKLKGVVSEAMVLAAKNEGTVELVSPPNGSKPGDLISVEGIPFTPSRILPEKKKYWETATKSLGISPEGVIIYRDLPLRTENGPLVAPTLRAGIIS
ncbi:unnamed protein product [Blepharisma stoltei]|uniref:tRNA-binding domain-containing protein n=1 Tax=Blepharisma stoltei TaxID=1481888 RepID=A0AAU9JAV3_9CILI|nr:unnamed protein product [Blepharisma stoltei]